MPIVEVVGGVLQASLALVGRDAFLTGWYDRCKKRIVDEKRIPGNHDIVKGIRTAQLCAVRHVAEQHKKTLSKTPAHEVGSDEHAFAQSLEGFITKRLKAFREHKLDTDVLTLEDLDHVLDDILKPSVQEGFEAPRADTRAQAIARALEQIEADAGRSAPPLFKQAFNGGLGAAGWYDAFSLYIAEELKTNDRFRSIFQAGQIVDLRGSVDQIIAELHTAHADLAGFIHDVRGQLGRIETDVKAIRFTVEEIKTHYAPELKQAQNSLHATEAELTSILAHILERRVKREDIPNALDRAWQRLSELRKDMRTLSSLANESPEIAPLIEQADKALSSVAGFSLDDAADALAQARKRYLKIVDNRDAQRISDKQDIAEILGREAQIAAVGFDYSSAVDFYRQQLSCFVEAHGEEHPNTATSYNSIAFYLNAQGRAAEAEPLFRKALEIRQRVLGEEHPHTATSFNNVASNQDDQGYVAEAEPLYRKALEIRQRVLGEEHPHTADSYNNVAYNLFNQGRAVEAGPLFRKALEIRQRVLGEEHPDTADSYNNVASNLNDEGRAVEAEPLYRKALEIRQRVLGEEHPDTAGSYNNVAYNLYSQGRAAEAEPLYRKALEFRQRVLGEEHPKTADIYNNVAYNLYSQGRAAEAEPLYRKALEIRQRMLGEEHPKTASSYNNLAAILHTQGRAAEAEPLYRKALEISQRVRGEEHPGTQNIVNNLAKCKT
ncbi:tetratricopeptide repeat protein [Hoeflea sp. EC-HK425]|uniref:tetratricopeptide repeat protein n=1 Tax=Hoeflea sp. EC-HK425 TaxID=2038388 RepID=UPI001257D9EB|nr:tetratricopeptide repeat protein [Hoeflea sp. EC-HK425]VVT19725.1 hypothetical protein HOE425_331760 [Hoeflea sp. EC-HK425]